MTVIIYQVILKLATFACLGMFIFSLLKTFAQTAYNIKQSKHTNAWEFVTPATWGAAFWFFSHL